MEEGKKKQKKKVTVKPWKVLNMPTRLKRYMLNYIKRL